MFCIWIVVGAGNLEAFPFTEWWWSRLLSGKYADLGGLFKRVSVAIFPYWLISHEAFQQRSIPNFDSTHLFMVIEAICKQHGWLSTLNSMQNTLTQCTTPHTRVVCFDVGRVILQLQRREQKVRLKSNTSKMVCLYLSVSCKRTISPLAKKSVVVRLCEWLSVTVGFTQTEVHPVSGQQPPT